ncbi:MAG: hypothetical protein QM650_18740 [Microlunatus sp.]
MSSIAGGGRSTMHSIVCEACGDSNPADATFCQNQECGAFLGWDRTSMIPKQDPTAGSRTAPGGSPPNRTPRATPNGVISPPNTNTNAGMGAMRGTALPDEASIETRVMPPITFDEHPSERQPVLAVRPEQDNVTVPVSGEPAQLGLVVVNRSSIVDGYELDVSGAPQWLRIESSTVKLLPGSEDRLVVTFRIESESLVPAGSGVVRLSVRSLAQPAAQETVSVTVAVPVVEAPVQLRTEPSVVRIRDVETGRFVVVVDNSGSNRAARLRLSGTDPELAVAFHFDPEVVVVGPGESTRIRAVTTSRRPEPGKERSHTLTVSAIEGSRRVSTIATLVQSTSVVVEDPPVELIVAPALVRVRDDAAAQVWLTIDNRAGRHSATVRLTAGDPEGVVQVYWRYAEVRVAAGGTADVELQLVGPVPEAGTEVTRVVTVTASDGRRVSRTQVSLVHSASVSPMTTLAVGLDPSVLRLGSRRRGVSSVVVDNRRGVTAARVWLQGDDPENSVSFGFSPPELIVGPGQVLTSRVTMSVPRPQAGREVSRPLTVLATDGRSSVATDGTIIQAAADRRPWVRVLLTLAGALAMLMGAMLPLRAVGNPTSFGVSAATVVDLVDAPLDLGVLGQLVTFGIVLVVLTGLMAFGLTGRSGRLTRFSAVIAVLLTVALLVTIGVVGLSATPGSGTLLIVLGAVLGYIGGLLTRRSG